MDLTINDTTREILAKIIKATAKKLKCRAQIDRSDNRFIVRLQDAEDDIMIPYIKREVKRYFLPEDESLSC